MITIIMPTYNRAHTILRAINSIYAQKYQNWHLVIVDDGSTDDTLKLLELYDDPRMEIVQHPANRGVTAAKNTGFDHIKGEWFTILDSDDELLPGALDDMLSVPGRVNPLIDAVVFNCIDVSTGRFSGYGLDHDQYLAVSKNWSRRSGQFFGINKTELLGNYRFNEAVPGCEDSLWIRLEKFSTKYYVHKAAKLYHTEGSDRVLTFNFRRFLNFYGTVGQEYEWIEALRQFRPDEYKNTQFYICVVHIIQGRDCQAAEMLKRKDLFPSALHRKYCLWGMAAGPALFKHMTYHFINPRSGLRRLIHFSRAGAILREL